MGALGKRESKTSPEGAWQRTARQAVTGVTFPIAPLAIRLAATTANPRLGRDMTKWGANPVSAALSPPEPSGYWLRHSWSRFARTPILPVWPTAGWSRATTPNERPRRAGRSRPGRKRASDNAGRANRFSRPVKSLRHGPLLRFRSPAYFHVSIGHRGYRSATRVAMLPDSPPQTFNGRITRKTQKLLRWHSKCPILEDYETCDFHTSACACHGRPVGCLFFRSRHSKTRDPIAGRNIDAVDSDRWRFEPRTDVVSRRQVARVSGARRWSARACHGTKRWRCAACIS
jgi:hypothetical protein